MFATPQRFVLTALAFGLMAGCGPEGAPEEQRVILREHIPRLKEVIAEDRGRHWDGIHEAGERLARGFEVEDPETRQRQMRFALNRVQEPPRGIGAFIASPMSFLAAVDTDGIVVARDGDGEHDSMAGTNFAERYPAVEAALREGRRGMQLAEFPALEEGGESGFSWIFVGPAKRNGEVVGAVVAGIPLWRMAQRLTQQLRLERAEEIGNGAIIWAYVTKGERVFGPPDAAHELTSALPDAAARAAGLSASPGGYTGQLRLYNSKWFGYGLLPIPTMGEDVNLMVLRAGPTRGD